MSNLPPLCWGWGFEDMYPKYESYGKTNGGIICT